MLDTHAQLSQRIKDLSIIQHVRDVAGAMNLSAYIVGGALRDLVMTGQIHNDIDLVLETDEATLNEFYQRLLPKVRDIPMKLDLSFIDDAPLKAIQGDFTMNTLCYSLQRDQLIDALGGLDDIKRKTLKHASKLFFISSPKLPIKTFRLATQYHLTIHPDTLNLIRHYAPYMHSVTSYALPQLIGDFLKFLSLPKAPSALAQMRQLELLGHIIPEFLYALAPDEPESTAPLLAAMSRMEQLLSQCSKTTLSTLLQMKQDRYPTETEVYFFRYNPLAVARLALMLLVSVYQMDLLSHELPEPYQQESFLFAGRKQVFSNCADRYERCMLLKHMIQRIFNADCDRMVIIEAFLANSDIAAATALLVDHETPWLVAILMLLAPLSSPFKPHEAALAPLRDWVKTQYLP